MDDPIQAADVLADEWYGTASPQDANDALTCLRVACGWDGTGTPPTVVIKPDGSLATARTTLEGEFPHYRVAPVDAEGADDD